MLNEISQVWKIHWISPLSCNLTTKHPIYIYVGCFVVNLQVRGLSNVFFTPVKFHLTQKLPLILAEILLLPLVTLNPGMQQS